MESLGVGKEAAIKKAAQEATVAAAQRKAAEEAKLSATALAEKRAGEQAARVAQEAAAAARKAAQAVADAATLKRADEQAAVLKAVEAAAAAKAAEAKGAKEAAVPTASSTTVGGGEDPIQSLFLSFIRASRSQAAGLDSASPAIRAELEAELDRLSKQVNFFHFISVF